ncbi:MAG: tRNA 2-thiouridine(34) synthase MnmA [Bacteroidetes bacterium]|nr:tRNA 2-thiouridine(34) synthase MnmA [Bacteroidota bacterium]
MAAGSKKNITVAVGMSGGVDSSAAAAILVNEGYNVIGVTLKVYDYMEVGGNTAGDHNCCDLKAVTDARTAARHLGFPHHVLNLRDEFKSEVIKAFIDEYLKGRTPNPCVVCNQKIKWGVMLKKAEELGADFLATGHYARIRFDKTRNRYIISRGKSAEKDQSYALWAVSQEALGKTILPLGELSKSEVRALAGKCGLNNASKKESFEICFIPDDRYDRFLIEYEAGLKEKVAGGEIIRDGKIVGRHNGYPFYTIGQRKNIGAHREKMYVTAIDSGANRLIIGPDKELYHKTLVAGQVIWSGISGVEKCIRGQAKVRYKDDSSDCVVFQEGLDKIRVTFDRAKRAITPGQSVVVYDGDDLLCGGIIEKVMD